MYARVAILTEKGALAQTYTYQLMGDLEQAPTGACLLVPFQTQVRLGYLVEHLETADVQNVKSALGRFASGDVSPERVELAKWMAERWFSSIGACLRLMLPPAIRGRILRTVHAVDRPGMQIPGGRAGEIYLALSERGGVLLGSLQKEFGRESVQRALTTLRKHGLVREEVELSQGAGAPRTERVFEVISRETAANWLADMERKRPKQAAVLQVLLEFGEPLSAKEIAEHAGNPDQALRVLLAENLIRAGTRDIERKATEIPSTPTDWTLTEHQSDALSEIIARINKQEFQEILLYGVTASGKTEVYLKAIEEALRNGKSALVLMPEIALTVHALSQYRARFGNGLAVLHSRLSTGERADEWRRIQKGEATVVLGPRSAVFAPVSDIGIVIMDEEHESAFKQDSDPRYHARDVCRYICETQGIPLVLGSATPSIETYHRASSGESLLCKLPVRIDDRPMPDVRMVDMRTYAREGTLTVLSPPLQQELERTLNEGGQSIVFLNRRAYGTFVLCRECGYVAICPNCAVSAKHHREDNSIRCHHCNWRTPSPAQCPSCEGIKIASFGIGTQRVEEEMRAFLPDARLIRMDRDTTSTKDSLVGILGKFKNKEADILIGTQMVAKGLDFPGVLLVGVVNADTGMHMPDFRAVERGFQLLTQVAGRAGRGKEPGRVLFQTFHPEHYCLQAAAVHDYDRFFTEEIEARKELDWPPFGFIARILVQSASSQQCRSEAEQIARSLKNTLGVDVIGPSPAPIERLKQRWRWHILLRASDREGIVKVLEKAGARGWRGETAIDMDPVSLM